MPYPGLVVQVNPVLKNQIMLINLFNSGTLL